ITPEKRRRAAATVREGRVVSCSTPVPVEAAPDNPTPAIHLMVRAADASRPGALSGGSADWLGTDIHGRITHLDAFCHQIYRGKTWNGAVASLVKSSGSETGTVEAAAEGITSRGVLLDIPRLRGVDWLQLGEAILTENLEAAAAAERVKVETGDILLVRTGFKARNKALGPLPYTDRSKPGLHASVLPWLHARDIAVLGGDGDSDVLPSPIREIGKPVHLGCLVAMGVHLIDNCDLDKLADACAELGRWEFQFTVAPLLLPQGTGSPVNPLALL
ncbi:MAG TPA: cyclase family protein, partial [Dehalococcoidia bacterium]|nr:cyclase family protein [Dehalococcoidia bacterium]